jgi:hypothetical protein
MGDDRGRPDRKTVKGFGPVRPVSDPDLEPHMATFEDENPRPSQPDWGAPPRPRQPAVDIDLIHEHRTAPLPDQKWTFVEVWTRNTIYALDSRLRCVDVIDQGSKRSVPDHALLGARLVGGQSRDGDAMELSHPFPRPGSEAVFEQSRGRQVRFSQTSSVTRVVLRLRVLSVASDSLLPAWEEITGAHEVPKELLAKPSAE